MKKILSIMAVVCCLFMAVPAHAQFQFGIKGGLNVSKISVSKEVFRPDNKSGFFSVRQPNLLCLCLGWE